VRGAARGVKPQGRPYRNLFIDRGQGTFMSGGKVYRQAFRPRVQAKMHYRLRRWGRHRRHKLWLLGDVGSMLVESWIGKFFQQTKARPHTFASFQYRRPILFVISV
jgi:hypothetical protein